MKKCPYCKSEKYHIFGIGYICNNCGEDFLWFTPLGLKDE